MRGEGDGAWCESCGVRIERRQGQLLMFPPKDDLSFKIKPADLGRRICEHGGPMARATQADGTVRYSARADVSWRTSERPVWYRGELLGFAETMGPPFPATVTVDRETVSVDGDGSGAGSGRWSLLDIRAVQAASRSLQISLPGDRLVQFRFADDSPRRWEILLRLLISDAWEGAGRGRVVEFQPRIVAG